MSVYGALESRGFRVAHELIQPVKFQRGLGRRSIFGPTGLEVAGFCILGELG